MKVSIIINGLEHSLDIARESGRFVFDGEAFTAGAAEVRAGTYSVLIGGRSFLVRVARGGSDDAESSGADEFTADVDGVRYVIGIRDPRRRARARTGGSTAVAGNPQVQAAMPGKVVRVLVAEGQDVESGQGLVVVEAMKMQNEITSRRAGTVRKVMVTEGQAVNAGDTLLVVE